MESKFKQNMLRHNENLSPYACKDTDAIRFIDEKEDIRTPFFHDIDRILYSYAYARYSDKTQVFKGKENAHITKRMLHVQYVSKIARTIGRALGLNEDLIEAAALGHDLGHVPFGHFGESVLNDISLKVNEGYFNHNIESVRLLMHLESKGTGKNITIQVLDAIMCHNGEFVFGEYRPIKKTKEEFLEEYKKSYSEECFVKTLIPMTLEGCVVRISDIIAYLGKDIEDACILGKIKRETLPTEITDVLGIKTREIVNTITMDIIKNSIGKPYLKLSDEIYHAVVALKKFNYKNIYNLSLTEEEQKEITMMFEKLFAKFLKDIELKNLDSKIYTNFLNYKNQNYHKNTTPERKVIDFIAGMTDDYFLECYTSLTNEER